MSMEEEKSEQQSHREAVFPPVCSFCAHWDPTKGRHCAAFPSTRIPDQIWDGLAFHLRPVGGEQRDYDGQPIVFKIHPKAIIAAIEASNPALAKALRSGWARN